ncbi:MAG: phosphoglycerate dehydrogenase [Clostridiales bacterium]|nr:phosphoglycerate dehydrogenase [Clostridiales bacterium]
MDKVLVTNASFAKYSKRAEEILQDYGLEIIRVKQPVTGENDLLGQLDDVVAIITGLEPVTGKVINSAPRLRVIVKHGIGVDNIDLDAAKEKGVIVANSPGTNREAVADLVFGLMLSLARKIPQSDRQVREGKWPKVFGQSVWGKTLGIIGLGVIGKSVAQRAKGFNMKVLAFDKYWDEEFASANGIIRSEVDEILKESDFVTLHVPLMEETRNLIGEKQLSIMKPTAYLINAARGGVVDEDALYKALKEGRIAGAGIDVFSTEPPTQSPLLGLQNVILTPHMGGFTDGALSMTSEFVSQVVVDALKGREIRSRIV